MKFEGTADYVATPDLTVAVNAAITLERPLLVKGEPGTGKTELARQIAAASACPDRVAREVDDQGGAGPLRVRRGQPAARQPARRRRASTTSATTSGRGRSGRPSRRTSEGRAADRRDRQGRHRVPERPAAGARPDGVLRLRDRRDDPRQARGRSSSSPRTTRRSCPTPSCAAASSTTSAFPTRRR